MFVLNGLTPMASPFPGMDPYLEQPAFWSSFHTRFMVAIADELDSQIFPKYYVDVETRTYLDDEDNESLVGVPDGLVLTTQGFTNSAETNADL